MLGGTLFFFAHSEVRIKSSIRWLVLGILRLELLLPPILIRLQSSPHTLSKSHHILTCARGIATALSDGEWG